MASSSSSSHFAAAASSRSCKYDVFLSFRGEDTRKTFVDHLYSNLKQHLIRVYKDNETLPRGESIDQSLFEAIEESRIAVIVFSKNYADSSWCLEELAHIMKCKDERELIVLPIFYDVEPTDVRNQKGKFGKAFAKQKAKNVTRAEIWRKAFVDVSNIAGWEPKNIANGHESQFIKIIVDTVLDRLTVFISCVDEDLVGMTTRFQELQPLLDNRLGGVRMVGIWGVGGSGKSTLAYSLYKKISKQFDAHCILENIREKTSKYGLEKLQEIILGALSNTKENIQSVGEGKDKIKDMLCRMKVLLLLDDVSSVDQLEALAGKHSWFGSGSRILITTRDEHLLRTHKVGHIYPVKLLSDDEAIRLFKIHAYNEEDPVEDYETLSLHVVSYAAGLPLALKVLGSFLYDKNNSEWIGTLKKLKEIPDHEVMNILKISYDGLETYQKELFLDIACFWNKKSQHDAVEILEACGYHPGIGIKVLKQKALISIVDGNFDMHDLVQEMGHYIVRGEGEHPYSRESYSRLWKEEDIRNLCLGDAIKENYKIEAIKYNGYLYNGGHDFSSRFFKIVSKLKKLRWLRVDMHTRMFDGEPTFLNELCYADGYPTSSFLNSYPLMNLIILKFSWSTYQEVRKPQKENDMIKDTTHLFPSLLQENDMIKDTTHLFPSLLLENVTIKAPKVLFPSLLQENDTIKAATHKNFIHDHVVSGFQFPTKLHYLKLHKNMLTDPWKGLQLPNLKTLHLTSACNLLNTPDFDELPHLQKLIISQCDELVEIHSSLGRHGSLKYISVSYCPKLRIFPTIVHMENLKTLEIGYCNLEDGDIPSGIDRLSNLQELSLRGNKFSRLDFSLLQLTRLKLLNISGCEQLLELPQLPPGLVILKADSCKSVTTIGDCHKNCKQLRHVSLMDVIINDADRLLEFMLEVKAIENGCMLLQLEGVEIAKGFTPLLRGKTCSLQLPEKWYDDFCGFLICVVLYRGDHLDINIRAKVMSGMDYQSDVVWEERHSNSMKEPIREGDSDNHQTYKTRSQFLEENDCDKHLRTWVTYVSFGSLRYAARWDQTYKAISFEVDADGCHSFGVRLVDKKSKGV